jgi:ABC-2 type transport system permease protein
MRSLHVAAHLIRRTMGSKRSIFMNVMLPAIILSILTGLFASMEKDKHVIFVINNDSGILGAYMTEALVKEKSYDVQFETHATEQSLKDVVKDGKADASVYIPADFTQKMLAGEQPKAVMYRMNEQLWNASLAMTLVTEANKLSFSVNLIRSAGDSDSDLSKLSMLLETQANPKVVAENIGMKLGNILSNPTMIGLILMFVMLLCSQVIGFVMEDREQGTMARMFAAPLRSIDIAFGNFLGSLLVGTLQVILVLSLTYFVFGYSPGVPFGAMLLVLECFLFASVGLASSVAGIVRNSTQLSQINNIIITPTCMISGCFFSISLLPDFMQKLANFTPQKWAIGAIDRLGGGESIWDISLQLCILLLFAAVTVAFGSAVLRPNQRSKKS